MTRSSPRPAHEPRTDSVVPPIGDPVDLYGLPLTALVARLAHQLTRALAQVYVDQHIAAQPLDGSLLILLAMGAARLTELAERLNATKQALTFVVDRLERDGLVLRVADPVDKRAKRIELTEAGVAAAEVTKDAMRAIERRWRSHAGEVWPQLRAALADIASNP
jgi:DNA-binding MarR family transcriptional regulator